MEKLTKLQLRNRRTNRASTRSSSSSTNSFSSIRMARITIFSWLMLFILALASLSSRFGIGASPVIKTEVSSKPQEISGKVATGSESAAAAGAQHAPAGSAAQISSPPGHLNQPSTKPTNAKQVRAINADKLKRGLTNFMNHLNPAPYFVPTQLSAAGNKLAVGSQAEPSTIINDGPSADALIKGPNRLVQGRPLGGPLRWGR